MILSTRNKILGSCLAILLLALSVFSERLPVKTYTVVDGLLRDRVYCIRQDSRGFLWIGTPDGISRFDGVEMLNFSIADGLPDGEIGDFLETRGGSIYIATGKGLARINPKGVRGSKDNPLVSVFLPDNQKAKRIVALFEDSNNRVWVGTSDGLYKLVEKDGSVSFDAVELGVPLPGVGGAIFVPSPNTLYVDAIAEDRNGTLWVGTFGGGLFRLSKNGELRRYYSPANFTDNKVTAVYADREGMIWMGMRSDEEGGVCILDPTDELDPVRKCYTQKDGLSSNRIRDIIQTEDGQMWLATSLGLCRWQGESDENICKTYSARNDLCNDIFTLAEDKDGNLWTGSPCGAQKITRYGFTTYGEGDGLDDEHVTSVFEDSTGALYVTTFPRYQRMISRFDGERFSTVAPGFPEQISFHGWGWQQTVWRDSRGSWWVPSGNGLFRSDDGTSFEELSRKKLKKQETGAKSDGIFRLFEDSRGDVWVATTDYANELFRWEREKNIWHDLSSSAGISEYRVGTAFEEDSHGNVWIGASSDWGDGALIRYRNGEMQIFSGTSGAPTAWISDLFLDSRGRLWIASSRDGLLRLDDTNSDVPSFVRYKPGDGRTTTSSNCVVEDKYGRIYIGTGRGIDRLDPETGLIENFSTADGLPNSYIESAYRDRNDNLWFTSEKGLARYVPEPPRTRQPPNILITGLRVLGEPKTISILGETDLPSLELSPGQNQISIDFIGLGATLGEELTYDYRLSGNGWTRTDERTINFANLAPGDYTFEVRAVTVDRIFSKQAATLTMRIAAPVWQRWWFVLSILAVAIAIFFGLYRYRLNKLLEVERTRARIATDLHDDIGASLSKISLLSDIVNMKMTNGSSEDRRLLTTISEVSRTSVAAMRDIVWAIDPSRDTALDMTRKMREYAEGTFVPNNVPVDFAATESNSVRLSMDIRRELFLIFKEAVNNAARHSGCKRVSIEFRASPSEIFLAISDDGRGFEATRVADGNGLANMRSRAEKMGGTFEVTSGGGNGTTIKVSVPR